MPRLELALELALTSPEEREMLCWVCGLTGPEWKLTLQTRRTTFTKGIHTECKIDLESRRAPSALFPAVKP